MNITVESTTDSQEQVLAANAGKTPVIKVEKTEPETTSKDEALDPDEAGTTAGETEEQKAEKGKKLGGFQKKLAKKDAEIAARDKEIESLRQQVAPKEVPKIEKTEEVQGKPKVEDFDTHSEYVEALTDWKIEQKEALKEQKSKQSEQQKVMLTQKEAFDKKLEAFKETAEDFDELIDSASDLLLSGLAHDAIFTSDLAPEIMYELAKDRKELERIHKLSPVAQVREIGKVEARLTKEEVKETKTTKAPAPPSPVGSKGSSKSFKSPDEMTHEEYVAFRRQQKKK